MALLPFQDVVFNWVNTILEDVDEHCFRKSSRLRLVARLLRVSSSSDGATCKESEGLDADVMEELTSFIKEHFPSYYLDCELYCIMNDEDSEELLCLLSLMLFYCTMRSNASEWIQNALCSKLSDEMQVRVKTFIEKIPNDNRVITKTLVKEAVLESGLSSSSPPTMFSYSPHTNSSLKAQQYGTPLQSFFQSPQIKQQKHSIFENREVRKLKSQLDSVTSEYTDIQEELNQAQEQIRILNEKYQDKAQELVRLRKEMDSREKEASVPNNKNCNCESVQKLKQELKSIQNYVKVLEDKVSDIQEANYNLGKRAKHAEHSLTDFKTKVDEYESTLPKIQYDLQAAEERIKDLAEQNVELRDFIEKQKKELEISTDLEISVTSAVPDCAENLGQTVVDLQLHEQIEENKKLRIQLEEKINLEKQLQQLKEKLDSFQKETERLSQENTLLVKEKIGLNEQVIEMDAVFQRQCKERDEILKQHEADKQKLKAVIEELEESFKAAENLRLSLDNAVSDHNRLEGEMKLLTNEIDEVKSRLSEEQAKRIAISDELSTSKSSVLKLETDLKASNNQIVELEKQKDDLSSQCKNHEAQNETLTLKIKEIQGKVNVLEAAREADKQKLKAITEELEESFKAAENLRLSLDNAVSDHNRLAGEMKLLTNEIEEVKSRLSEEQAKRIAISDELSTSKSSVLKLETDLKASNNQIVELEKQKNDLSSQCKNHEAQNETLTLKIKEIQGRVNLLEEARESSFRELEIEKAVVKELNEAANSLRSEFLTLKAVNQELSIKENQLKFDYNNLVESAKLSESRLLDLEEQKSELLRQLERANVDIVNLKNDSEIQTKLHHQNTKVLEEELEQLSNKILSLESQIAALERHKHELSQKLETVEVQLNKEKQTSLELLQEKSKILQETQENLTKEHSKVLEIQTSFNRELARIMQERDSTKLDLHQAQEKIQALKNNVQKIEGTLSIYQNELHEVLYEFKHVVSNFVNIRDKLTEYHSIEEEIFVKLLATNVEDIQCVDEKLTILEGDFADNSGSNTTRVSQNLKNLKLFNITLNVLYEFVLSVCSKYTLLQNEITKFQLDNSEMKKLNEVVSKQNLTLMADNTSLHNEVQAYKVKEEISKKLDIDVKQLSDTVDKLEKEKNLLLESSNKQKIEIEALHDQNQILLNKNMSVKDEIKELMNQNKQIKESLAETRSSSLKLGEGCWKLISRKHEADVVFERVFTAKHELSQKMIDAQRCLKIVEATYGKKITTLSLTDNIRALKLENEAKLSCVEKEFNVLTKEALSALHLCLDQTKKNIDQYEIILKNITKTKSVNTPREAPGCVTDVASMENAFSEKSELNFTESFDFITLTELTLKNIESRICGMSSQMDIVLERCKCLESKCNETFDVKTEILSSCASGTVSNSKTSPHSGCDMSSEDDGWNPDDSLEPKTEVCKQHSLDIAVRKEDLEKTLSEYKIKTQQLNEELLSVKLSLSVSESEKSEFQKQLMEVNHENEVLQKEKAKLLNLNSKLEDRLKETEKNVKMRSDSYSHHLASSYAALKSEHSALKAKLSEKENEILEQKRMNINLNSQFQKEMEKKTADIREEYEQKLGNLKSKMREVYQEEVGKITQKLTAAEEKMVWYRNMITKLKSKVQELSSKLTCETQEKNFLEKQLYMNHNSGQVALTSEVDMPGEMSVPHSTSEEPLFALPQEMDRRQSIASVVDERITYVTRRSVHKAVPAGMGRVFHEEDEEGEVFNNTYLADVKAGRCNFGREDSKKRLSELQYRNSLCPPHLKSSYPAETQFHDPSVVKDDDIKITYNKPGPPTPGKKGRLSLQGSDASNTPRSVLKEFNESTSSRKGNTPSRIKALFSTKSNRRDEVSKNQKLKNFVVSIIFFYGMLFFLHAVS